ncbi:thioredoxin family protein [Enterococcus faecium]
MYAKKNKKAVYLVISLAAMVTLVLGSTQLSRIQQEPLKTITIQGIDSIMDSKGNSIVYIGRENCPDCILYKPKLISYLEKEKLEINYLDTTGNKTDVDNFRKYYNKLGVESIPAVIFIKNGKVERILYGDKEAENIERTIKLFKTS